MPGEPAGIAVSPGDGERVRSPIGGDVTLVVTGDQSNGALAALDVVAPPGEGPPLHVHNREDETVYILEGEFRWKLGAELCATQPGSFVFIPRGLAHCFQCVGQQPGRMLITFAPAGMEGFFERLSSLTAFDLEAFRDAAAEHGMDVVGPPLAESDPL
jgi:quercetin dioxygenase-like cupin family protein